MYIYIYIIYGEIWKLTMRQLMDPEVLHDNFTFSTYVLVCSNACIMCLLLCLYDLYVIVAGVFFRWPSNNTGTMNTQITKYWDKHVICFFFTIVVDGLGILR